MHKLQYFDLPGRGEAVRLALTLSGIEFEDKRFPRTEWAALKPTTPWLSVPVLELPDGARLAQTHSILRYIGSLGTPSLYPKDDALTCARVDELMDAINDAQVAINNVGSDLDLESKRNARASASADGGILADFLSRIDGFVAEHGRDGHAVSGELTIADVKLFCTCSFLVSGFFDGVPRTALDKFEHIQRVRKRVASLPAVMSWYDRKGDALLPLETGFRDARNLLVPGAGGGVQA